MQDPLLLIGGLVAFVIIVAVIWFIVLAPRRVDRAFVEFASIIGEDGGSPGFQKATSTGQPQMLINMKPNTELSSMVCQYGHSNGTLSANKRVLNVAGYHTKQGLKVELFARPKNKPSSLALRTGPPVKTTVPEFDDAITVDYADDTGRKLLNDNQFQQSLLQIEGLKFFEIRPEGAKTLIWGERNGVSVSGFQQLYIAIRRAALLLA